MLCCFLFTRTFFDLAPVFAATRALCLLVLFSNSSPICYLQTVALHMHVLVRTVRLFGSAVASRSGSGTKGSILVPLILISNSWSWSQGTTRRHVLGFQSLLKYPASRHTAHHRSAVLDGLLNGSVWPSEPVRTTEASSRGVKTRPSSSSSSDWCEEIKVAVGRSAWK